MPITDPTSEAFTTSCSPSTRAKNAMISSGALPNVTLRSAPTPGPDRAARASVASLMSTAGGTSPSAAVKKTGAADEPVASRTTATGMKTASA